MKVSKVLKRLSARDFHLILNDELCYGNMMLHCVVTTKALSALQYHTYIFRSSSTFLPYHSVPGHFHNKRTRARVSIVSLCCTFETPRTVKMTIDLYYSLRSPPSRSVLLVAKALGVEFNLKQLSGTEYKTPEFLKVGTVH
jgi:hypothetical protein